MSRDVSLQIKHSTLIDRFPVVPQVILIDAHIYTHTHKQKQTQKKTNAKKKNTKTQKQEPNKKQQSKSI